MHEECLSSTDICNYSLLEKRTKSTAVNTDFFKIWNKNLFSNTNTHHKYQQFYVHNHSNKKYNANSIRPDQNNDLGVGGLRV